MRDSGIERSTPDDALLIQEVFDHFNTVAHLDLGLLGHGQHRANQLPRFHIHKGRNSLTRRFFKIAAEASQGRPPG
jgi:hypothetical protein